MSLYTAIYTDLFNLMHYYGHEKVCDTLKKKMKNTLFFYMNNFIRTKTLILPNNLRIS